VSENRLHRWTARWITRVRCNENRYRRSSRGHSFSRISATDRFRFGISFTWTPAAIREHDDQRQSSMPSCETQPISGTSPSAGRGAAVQCIISRSTSREWDLAARLGSPGSGRSGNSVTGLVTLVSRTPSGCRQPRRGFESPTRGSFSTRFHEPFVPDARDTHGRAYLLALAILSRPLDGSRIFNLPREMSLNAIGPVVTPFPSIECIEHRRRLEERVRII